jgi:hypothetical protein
VESGLDIGVQLLILSNFRDLVINENDRNPAREADVIPTEFQVVHVIPASLMKGVVNHRRTKQEPNLVSSHTDFRLIKIFLFEYVPLRYILAIHAAAGQSKAQKGHYQ